MGNDYKVIGADGKEYGPATTDDLRRWYIEGRIGKENYLLQIGTDEQWRRLEEVFDLSGWTAPSVKRPEVKPDPLRGVSTLSILGLNPAAAPDVPETPETPETPEILNRPEETAQPKRRPGMLAA